MEEPRLKKEWKNITKKMNKYVGERENTWWTANVWEKGDKERTYINVKTQKNRYRDAIVRSAGYLDEKTGEYVPPMSKKGVNINEL